VSIAPRRQLTEAVHEHPAHHHQEDVGQAVDRIEGADLRVAEVQLAVQHFRHRPDRIVDIVVAEHDEPGGDEEHGLRRDGGPRAGGGEGSRHNGAVSVRSAASSVAWKVRRSPEGEPRDRIAFFKGIMN
jgi:hypothetical protein